MAYTKKLIKMMQNANGIGYTCLNDSCRAVLKTYTGAKYHFINVKCHLKGIISK